MSHDDIAQRRHARGATVGLPIRSGMHICLTGASNPMGLPAIKAAYENLAAELPATRRAVSPPGEVISLAQAQTAGKHADTFVAKVTLLRTLLIQAALATEQALDERDVFQGISLSDARMLVSRMEETRRHLAGDSILHIVGLDRVLEELEGKTSSTSSAARYRRRLGKRMKEAAETCEPPRLRVVAVLDRAVPLLQALPLDGRGEASSGQSSGIDFINIFEASLARYPVITEYLAR